MAPPIPKQAFSKTGWSYAGLGFEFIGMFLACAAFGHWMDSLFWPEKSWGLLGGIFLGFFAGLFHVLLRTKEIEKLSDEQAKKASRLETKENTQQKIDRIESEISDVSRRLRDALGDLDSEKRDTEREKQQ